ncbi:MAG: glutathione S-transferase family protein [Gammaproteobacteria bacterium]|nr:glutathione S-transferase family protein [Gammaproteobacteria bacterium]
MKVYGDVVSGNCLKVQYTADYLAIAYEWIPIDIQQQESRSDEFLALNPAGQVPLIVLPDGRTLAQSNAIIGFLAAGSALLPGDPYDLAKVNEWLFWEQYSHEPYVAVCRFAMKYLGKSAEEREPWRVERGEIALDHLENALQTTQWLASASFTIADIALLAYTRLAAEGGFNLAARPQVRAWIERCEGQLDIKRADDTS